MTDATPTLRPPDNVAWSESENAMRMWWDGDLEAMSGLYDTRAGICWPVVVNVSGTNVAQGAVLKISTKLPHGPSYILEVQDFMTVPTYVFGGQLRHPGLAKFLAKLWTTYHCDTLYYNANETEHDRWAVKIYRDKSILPDPMFIEVQWGGNEEGFAILTQMLGTGQLYYNRGSPLYSALRSYTVQPGAVDPYVHAAMCAVTGLTDWPFRRKKEL